MNRNLIRTLAQYAFGFGLLAVVIWQYWAPSEKSVGLSVILQRPIQLTPLVIAASLCLGSLLLSFVRWYFLVRALDLPFTLTNAVRLGLIGYFWSTLFPGSVGGDVVKAYCISREQKRRAVAVASVLIDRAIGLWALIWFVALLGGTFWAVGDPAFDRQPYLKQIVYLALGLVGFTSVLWIVFLVLPQRRGEIFAGRLSRIPKLGGAASEFWRAVWMYRGRQSSIILALLLALVGHVGWVLTYYFSVQVFLPADAVDQIPRLTEHFLIVPVAMTGQAFFPSPGGVGGGEAFYSWLYELVKKSGDVAVAGSLTQRAITWCIALVGYLAYWQMPKAERVDGSWSGHAKSTDEKEDVRTEAAVA